MTLILEVTPVEETVVTPCKVVRRLLASVVVDSIFLRGALFGMGITSTPPLRLTFFFFALAFGFDPVCLSSIAKLAGVRGFPGGFAGGSGELGRGGAMVSTLLLLSLALEEGALVDGTLVLAEASERGARPRTGAAGRGAGGATVGNTTAAPGAVAGASGRTVGAAIGGAAFGGGRVGGLTTPEFQGATLFGLLFFRALLYSSNSRCCFLMTLLFGFLLSFLAELLVLESA